MARQMDAGLGLPEAGGLLDQPRRLMLTMRACASAYTVMAQWAGVPVGQGADWLKANREQARVYDYVMTLRERYSDGE